MKGRAWFWQGPAAEKTRVLTRRVAFLLEKGVPGENILAITFTNKAAQEMKSRVASLVPNFSGQWIQTFHAACYRILKIDIEKLGYDRHFVIMDDNDTKALVKEILKEERDFETRPEDLLYRFKEVKNSLQEPEKFFENLAVPHTVREKAYRIYRLYNARLKELNGLDFEDLILLCIRLFKECPEVLAKYRELFRFIMVDEYQDTNYSQYVWTKLLADKYRNIFIVGDPDQSIYSWRGAEPYNIKRFLTSYPDALVVKLETNYRSTGNILEAANAVIKNNIDREEKELRSHKGQGDKLYRFCASDSFQEARFIADTIADLVDREGWHYRDCAIFYRTHAQSRIIEEALLQKYIPYSIIGARRFYDRKEVKDILAYLRIICNDNDRLSFRRIINTPRRGIGDKTLQKIEAYAADEGISILAALGNAQAIPGITKKVAIALEEFYGMITYFSSLNEEGVSVAEILDNVIETSSYLAEIKRTDPDAATRIENLQELKSLAIEFARQGGDSLEDFLAQVALVQDADDVDLSDAVLLMTFHGAKGLEFPLVFMTGMEEGVFPSYRSETPEEIEEERRLCYVGITRAEERLYLTNAISRLLYGYERNNAPSRFIQEIPEELFVSPHPVRVTTCKLEAGDQVIHRKFGLGVIIKLIEEDEIAVIDFDRAGTRMLRLDIAPLEKIS